MKIVSFSSLAVAALVLFVSTTSKATTNCSGIQKQILCVSYSDCSWVNGYCANKSFETQDSQFADESDLMTLTGGWEYLGCSVDDQQCAWRASNQNYSQHRSETSIYCPNASKMGCYGKN